MTGPGIRLSPIWMRMARGVTLNHDVVCQIAKNSAMAWKTMAPWPLMAMTKACQASFPSPSRIRPQIRMVEYAPMNTQLTSRIM